jgi:hypothetical protein
MVGEMSTFLANFILIPTLRTVTKLTKALLALLSLPQWEDRKRIRYRGHCRAGAVSVRLRHRFRLSGVGIFSSTLRTVVRIHSMTGLHDDKP